MVQLIIPESTTPLGAFIPVTELSRLNDRLEMYEHIPFLITLENGRVVKIEEMDSLFH